LRRYLYISLIIALFGALLSIVSFTTHFLDVKGERLAVVWGESKSQTVSIQDIYLEASSILIQYELDVDVPSHVTISYEEKDVGQYYGSIKVYSSAGLLVYTSTFNRGDCDKFIEIPQSGVYTIAVEVQGFNENWYLAKNPPPITFSLYKYWRPFLILGPCLIVIGLIGILVIFIKKGTR